MENMQLPGIYVVRKDFYLHLLKECISMGSVEITVLDCAIEG